MKRLCNILCALLLLGTMTSCEDWLDVDPKSEVKSDVMFQSVSGFKDALTGIYLLMSDQDLYGTGGHLGIRGCLGTTDRCERRRGFCLV